MRHLYAHLPFCPSKCHYCAFVTHVGSLRLVQPYVEALILELNDRVRDLEGPFDTVYFGGGTPSMLSPEQIGVILDGAQSAIGIAANPEVTMEAHPGTLRPESLTGYRERGVNRLSIGVEALDRDVLSLAGRRYDAGRISLVVDMVRQTGFDNLSLDLIYGLPGQSAESWRRSLDMLLTLEPDHVSLYPLSIEPGTVFSRRSPDFRFPNDVEVVEMYAAACEALRAAGFEHYEVANWARPGKRSRHNLAYWTARPYVAAGVGAHGYLHGSRYVNRRGVKRYIESIAAGEPTEESIDPIDPAAELDEYLILHLRLLQEGVSLRALQARYGPVAAQRVLEVAHRLRPRVRITDGRMTLPELEVPLANEIWSEFLGLHSGQEGRPLDLVS